MTTLNPAGVSRSESRTVVPTRIGRFLIEYEVGRGGMGVVYRAVDPDLDRLVAIKTLPPAIAGVPGLIKRLSHEARTIASLNHPCVATVHAFESTANAAYIVMEFIDGQTLGERLEAGPLGVDEVLGFGVQIADAVEAAHACGVVHRDLKPGNVMIRGDGRLKVLDFGIAVRVDGSQPSDGLRIAVGTPGYMSPEQARGETVDYRSDVWSFGALLYECLVGVSPPIDGGDGHVMPADVPDDVAVIINGCLAPDPDERPADLGVVRHALEAAVARRDDPDGPAGGLPVPWTSFFGRARETRRVALLLARHRVVTLVGIGGVGKTRLALETARALARSGREVCWVDLARARRPEAVATEIAAALGARERPGRPAVAAIADACAERKVVVCLDNCEHLVAAVRRAVRVLLDAGSGVQVLATSREPLGVDVEARLAVEALPTPAPSADDDRSVAEWLDNDAVALFAARARAASSSFEPTPESMAAVAEICQRVDGLPLAIELAAARVAQMPVRNIARRLRGSLRLLARRDGGAAPRHRTLRATIEWSDTLLEDPERSMLRRLSVFAGGFGADAANAICSDEAGGTALRALATLRRRSLVTDADAGAAGPRWRCLEPIRQYAAEGLAAEDAVAETRDRHLAWFARLAEHSGPALCGPQATAWTRRIDVEYPNLRAALVWSQHAGGDPAMALRLATALWRYWQRRGRFEEGRRWVVGALAMAGDAPTRARAAALAAAGNLASSQRDVTAARSFYESARALYDVLDDRVGVGRVLVHLGNLVLDDDEPEQARALHARSLSLARETGNPQLEATGLANLAASSLAAGDADAAEALYVDGMARQVALGDPEGVAMVELGLARVAIARRDPAAARDHLVRCFERLDDTASITFVVTALEVAVVFLARPGDFWSSCRAAELLAADEALRDATEMPATPRIVTERAPALARLDETLSAAVKRAARRAGARLSSGEAVALALDTIRHVLTDAPGLSLRDPPDDASSEGS